MIKEKEKDSIFLEKKRRFNKEILKICLQTSGIKDCDAYEFSDKIFEELIYNTEKFIKLNPLSISSSNNKILTTKSYLINILKLELTKKSYMKSNFFDKLELAFMLVENKVNMIILLGGTSGTGKSSVASLLATKIGIPTVLSTDSIRHIMRNFLDKESFPFLFASTYEAGKKLPPTENITDKQRITKGYLMQSQLIQEKIEGLIDTFYENNESIVIEGVHLTPDFMKKISKKYPSCVSFQIYISNESKHKERFAVRSKYMTLDERFNKYVENFNNIRIIQKFLLKKSDEFLIPKIDNSNIDKSMGSILKTIMSYFRKIYIKKEQIPDHNSMLFLYEEYNKISKNLWSSQNVKDYIMAKVNKTELLNMKMENLMVNLGQPLEVSPEKTDFSKSSLNNHKIPQKFEENLEFFKEKKSSSDDNHPHKDSGNAFKINEENKPIFKSNGIFEESAKIMDEVKNPPKLEEKVEESKILTKTKIQIKDIKDMILNQNKKVLSLDKNIKPATLLKLKNMLNDINKKSKKYGKYYSYHMFKNNERIIIYKRTHSLKDLNIQENVKQVISPKINPPIKPEKKSLKHLSKDDTSNKDEFYGITSGTDEEEISSTGELKSDIKSSLAESMEVNFHGGAILNDSISEKWELSEHDTYKIEEEIEDNFNSLGNSENSENSISSASDQEEKKSPLIKME